MVESLPGLSMCEGRFHGGIVLMWLFILIVFALVSVVGEYVLLWITDHGGNPHFSSRVRKICQALFIIITIFYLGLFGLLCMVTFANFQNDDIQTGLKMLFTIVIVGAGIYYLFLKKLWQ